MKQYSDIQFSPICLSNEPIDGLKVTAVAIQLCQWETTMPWFLLRSKTQQAGLNLCFSRSHHLLHLLYFHISFLTCCQ